MMKKYKFEYDGCEPDIECTRLCKIKCEEDIKIGSASCKECENLIGFDDEEMWIKCSKLKEATGVDNVELSKKEEIQQYLFNELEKFVELFPNIKIRYSYHAFHSDIDHVLKVFPSEFVNTKEFQEFETDLIFKFIDLNSSHALYFTDDELEKVDREFIGKNYKK